MKRYLMTLILSLCSFGALADDLAESKTYKDELLRYASMIGEQATLTVNGYADTVDPLTLAVIPTEQKTLVDKVVSTHDKAIQVLTYHPNNKNITIRLVYGYGKLYEVDIGINIFDPKNRIYNDDFSFINRYIKDLDETLQSNHWDTSRWFNIEKYNNLSYTQGTKEILVKKVSSRVMNVILIDHALLPEYTRYVEEQKEKAAEAAEQEAEQKMRETIKIN